MEIIDMKHLTVGKLKELIEDVDDDTIVAGIGHFGETLNIEPVGLQGAVLNDSKTRWQDGKKVTVFVLNCEDMGPDPE